MDLLVDNINNKERILISKIFRDTFNYSITKSIEIIKEIPGIIYKETKTEVNWIKMKLDEKKINVLMKTLS